MAMLVLDEGAPIGTADGHSGGACTETCTLFIMPCAKQRNVVLGVIWSFVIMANPGDTTGTVGAQQLIKRLCMACSKSLRVPRSTLLILMESCS